MVLRCLDPQKLAFPGPKMTQDVDLQIATEGDAGCLPFGKPIASGIFV